MLKQTISIEDSCCDYISVEQAVILEISCILIATLSNVAFFGVEDSMVDDVRRQFTPDISIWYTKPIERQNVVETITLFKEIDRSSIFSMDRAIYQKQSCLLIATGCTPCSCWRSHLCTSCQNKRIV
jgi:hypothetical protein